MDYEDDEWYEEWHEDDEWYEYGYDHNANLCVYKHWHSDDDGAQYGGENWTAMRRRRRAPSIQAPLGPV